MTVTKIPGLTSIVVFYLGLFVLSPRETGIKFSPVLRLSRTFITNVYKRFYFFNEKRVYKRFYLFFQRLYIGWQWRNFFKSAAFRHFVGQALRNVCCSDVSRRQFLNKIAIDIFLNHDYILFE